MSRISEKGGWESLSGLVVWVLRSDLVNGFACLLYLMWSRLPNERELHFFPFDLIFLQKGKEGGCIL